MFSFLKPKKNIITHDGKYHADEVFACAVLLLVLEKRGERGVITRTRDESLIQKADYVIDQGAIYDPAIGRFDHHQPEGAGVRENGIPYASFGILWKEFGMELCNNKEVVDSIDLEMAQAIDAIDNGVEISDKRFKDVGMYNIGSIFSSFRPTWKESFSIEDAFDESLVLAKKCLTREIAIAQSRIEARSLVEKFYNQAEDKRIIFLDQYVPWSEVITAYPESLFVVSKSMDGNSYVMQSVRNPDTKFINRKDMPAAWAGLRNEALAKVSGVPDAMFCHKGLWIATAKSREGIMELAKKALLM